MTQDILPVGFAPPVQLTWRRGTPFRTALAGNDSLFGITAEGRIQALVRTTGALRWETPPAYVPTTLVRNGNQLWAYRQGQGLTVLDDLGSSVTERLVLSFGAQADVNMSEPVIDGDMVYIAVNQGFYAAHLTQGMQFGELLSAVQPHRVMLTGARDILLIEGTGVPSRYRVTGSGLQLIWRGSPHGVSAGQLTHPAVVSGNYLVIGLGMETVAYNLTNGGLAWRRSSPCLALTADANVVYSTSHGAAVRALRLSDGALLWERQFLYNIGLQLGGGIVKAGDYLYIGGPLRNNPDGGFTMAVRAADGSFALLSRAARGEWAAGYPLADDTYVYTLGTSHVGALRPLERALALTPERISLTPRPLRGRASSFGSGTLRLDLAAPATLSAAVYREAQGLGTRIVTDRTLGAGSHTFAWTVTGAGGFSDTNQFGYLMVDVQETDGVAYTQSLLLPVNTFPDILSHWARNSIEIMVFHQFVGGYPDQMFRPDNLVTRAESATIIAKTLNLEQPSPGFVTKFTDVASHWARAAIVALEEQGIIGGFLEPDGSFTFRPDLQMTRAQEARILVRAYNIPAAAPGFETRFRDIADHWAEADIKALESAGYVNGFQEIDGSFTYRPEQNLTRAELCTILVRVRNLAR